MLKPFSIRATQDGRLFVSFEGKPEQEYLPKSADGHFLKNETSEWQTLREYLNVTCHSRLVGGVLCRWWGEGPEPPGVAILNKALEGEKSSLSNFNNSIGDKHV